MVVRSLQPKFARHLMGFPHTDFGSLVRALYDIEDGLSQGLWLDSSSGFDLQWSRQFVDPHFHVCPYSSVRLAF